MTGPARQIRVLIVDDSVLTCRILSAAIASDPQLTVAGMAHTAAEALRQVDILKPDFVTLDLFLGDTDGLAVTRQIMDRQPTPILLVTSVVSSGARALVLRALACGALDVVDKASAVTKVQLSSTTLLELTGRIKALAGARVARPRGPAPSGRRQVPVVGGAGPRAGGAIVAIVASTGGPHALAEIVRALPAGLSCGVVVVQHIAHGFVEQLVGWLAEQGSMPVESAAAGAVVQAGRVYVAPSGVHMRIAPGGVIELTPEAGASLYQSSGDILLSSVAEAYGRAAVGVILTGMGRDGTLGLQRVKALGGKAFAQDEASCVIFGMPKSAIEAGCVDAVLPLDQIASRIVREMSTAPYQAAS